MNSTGHFLALALSSLVPVLAAAVGGMFAERARATNIALDGTMLVAALAALAVDVKSGSAWVGLLGGIGAGIAYSALLAFAVFVLRCDLIIAGIAANLLATGLTLLVVQNLLHSTGTYAPQHAHLLDRPSLGFIRHIPILGTALNRQSVLLYVVVVIFVFGAVVMNRTRFGVHIKAVGDGEEAAEAAGINPRILRTAAILISGAGAGVGGAYLSLSSVASFNSNLTGGLGFIAFAAVIFGRARPLGTVLAVALFSVATAASIQLQGNGFADPQLLQIVPYAATILALAVQAVRTRRITRFDTTETTYLPAVVPRGE